MSDGEVKRWYLYTENEALYAVSKNQRGFVPDASTIEVMSVEDHERIVAELRAEVAQLKVELGRPYDKVDRLFEANKKHLETIASQKRVIEKLIEQRNVYHTIATEWGATETPFETLEAQIAAIEKGVRSEQR